MEPHLADLLSNNHPPSEAELHEVKTHLLTPLRELAEIDSEIEQLEGRLQALKTKRDAIKNSMKDYQTILSPIRRIPSDILHEIFYYCLAAQRNPVLSFAEAPILLTHVSSTWRSIAFSSSRLWAQIHITFSGDYRTFDQTQAEVGYNVEKLEEMRVHTAQTLRQRCEIIKIWHGRSGTCPLSVSIHYSPSRLNIPENAQDEEGDLTIDLFKILVSHKDRWRNIEMSMPITTYRKLETLVFLDPLPLPMLTSLKLHLYDAGNYSSLNEQHGPVKLFNAPNLRKVSIVGPQTIWRFKRLPLDQWANQLTSFCCHSPMTVSNSLELLKLCVNLAYVKLLLINNIGALENSMTDDLQAVGAISLPNLRALCVAEQFVLPQRMAEFYDSIDAPHLTWIDHQLHHPTYIYTTDPPFLPLLRRSVQLRKLTVDAGSMPLQILRRVLAAVSPTLTHLVVGPEPEGPLRSMPRQQSFPSKPGPQYLGLLTIQGNESSDPNPFGYPQDGSEILLPRLEVFESTVGVNMKDHQLLQFITSRMNPSLSSGVTVLKRVSVKFYRMKEIDVIQAVERFLDGKGMEVRLPIIDLDYTLTVPRRVLEPIAPSFAFSQDGRSWLYPDIEDSLVPPSH